MNHIGNQQQVLTRCGTIDAILITPRARDGENGRGSIVVNEGPSILFLDDDPEFCRAMASMFERSGYKTAIANDGCEAFDMISNEAFDLIFSELRMPGLTAIKLMQEVSRRKIKVPVIFLTARGEVESYMDLMNMGAFDYLTKPIKGKEILRVAEKALGPRTISSP